MPAPRAAMAIAPIQSFSRLCIGLSGLIKVCYTETKGDISASGIDYAQTYHFILARAPTGSQTDIKLQVSLSYLTFWLQLSHSG